MNALRLGIGALTLGVLVAVCLGQESTPSGSGIVQTHFSNDGTIKIQFDPAEHPEVHVWLSSSKEPDTKKALGDTFFYVQDVNISPENRWIVVKNGTASAGTSLILFRRAEGLDYKEAGRIDPEAALKVLVTEKKIPGNFVSAHLHVSAVGWLDEEAGALVLHISGDGGAGGGQTNHLDWVCMYQPATGKITSLNRNILQPAKAD